MDYKEFANEVKRQLEEIVKVRYEDAVVVLRTIRKNNNVKRDAISIIRKSEMATPTIYMMDFYYDYQKGMSIERICEEIFEAYLEGVRNVNERLDIRKIFDFEKIKDSIMYRVVNYKMNEDMLVEHPHFKFLDMAIVFFVMIEATDEGVCTALINHAHLGAWNITPEEIREIAYANTWREYPPVIRKMEDVVSELIIRDIIDECPEDVLSEDICYGGFTYGEMVNRISEELTYMADDELQMYVLTNEVRCNGAACITYPNVLKEFADKLEADLYVIPSSIHEVIIIPKVKEEKERYDNMVKEVNSYDMDPIDILSDHAYLFNREAGELEC